MNFSNIKDWTIPQGSVTMVTDSHGIIIWEKSGGHDYSQDYFFIEDVSGQSNTVTIIKYNGYAPSIEVFKSSDGTNWESMGSTSTTGITATIPANGKLYLKATVNNWSTGDNYNRIGASGAHNVGGNIMSLLYGDNFQGQTSFPSTNTKFNYIFYGNDKLVSASKLVLPATTLNGYCYRGMFNSCTSLTTAPALPATTLAEYCYNGMFTACYSLTTAPELPATTLASYCYQNMFNSCRSLTTAPALPATTMADSCYRDMFRGCVSLTIAPALRATTLANSCYSEMFYSCNHLTTAPELPATTLASSCYSLMFTGCRSLTTAPELPATTLASYCYQNMFWNCVALTTAPELPATTLVYGCYYYMFRGCTNLNSITTYATDISASRCLDNWLYDVSATGDFFNLGGATYPSGASGIPTGWTEHKSL